MISSALFSPWTLLIVPVLYYILPYIRNHSIRHIPGPKAAAFSNLWLLAQARTGKRYRSVDAAHKKYGKFVRIQPNHVSIADAAAIPIIYGHGNGFLKSEYYDAFVSIHRGVFNTRDRADHARKRRLISHAFSAKSVGQFEQYMHASLELFLNRWTDLSKLAHGQYAETNALRWLNYLAFDIIGDLAFGTPFGMLERGQDIAEVRLSPDMPVTYAPAIEVINRRGDVSSTLGCLPALKPYAKYLPDTFFSKGLLAVENLAGIAVARVSDRRENVQPDRVDLLARLFEGRDANGDPMSVEELTAEALTQLIAGSDTTSNTSCALLYYVVKHTDVADKLREELDSVLPTPGVPSFDEVRDLQYLDFVIRETMRIHSTSSLGLPRLVVGSGVDFDGHYFPPGTVLSVPTYTIHHSPSIWGEDADDFRPERWMDITEKQKAAFNAFSYGPRACIGRNIAEMELALITATLFKNFDFVCGQTELKTREGFLRKPTELQIGLKRRFLPR